MSVAGSDCEWNPDCQLVLAALAGLIPKGGAAVGNRGVDETKSWKAGRQFESRMPGDASSLEELVVLQ